MRRRMTAALLAAAALLLSACGGPLDPRTDDPHTLVVHSRFAPGSQGADVYAAAVAEFERENPGVHVKNLYSADDIFNVFETSRLAHKEADVLMINLYDKAFSWTALGATEPVGDYLREWGLTGRVQPEALKAWTDDKGRLRAFPWEGFTWPVLANTRLMAEAGIRTVPTTVDELIADARALRAKGIAPMAVGGNDWSGQKLLMQVMQAYMPPTTAERVFAKGGYCASPQAMKGLALFAKLRDAGVFVKDAQGFTADQMNADYFEGRAAMIPAISSTIASVPAPVAATTKVIGLPVPPGGEYPHPTLYNGLTSTGIWVTPNGAGKIGMVEKFVKFFYRQDTVQRFVDGSGYVMNLTDQQPSTTNELVAQSVRVAGSDQVSEAVMPDSYVPAAVSEPLNRATSLAYGPGTSPRAMCKALDDAYAG